MGLHAKDVTAELMQAGFVGVYRRTVGVDTTPWHLNLCASNAASD